MTGFFPALAALQLKTDAVTDAGLAVLTRLTALEQLELVDCEAVAGAGLPRLLRSLPRLMVRLLITIPCKQGICVCGSAAVLLCAIQVVTSTP